MKYIEANKPVVVCECGVVMQPTNEEVYYEMSYNVMSFETKEQIRVACPKCKAWIKLTDASENCFTNAVRKEGK